MRALPTLAAIAACLPFAGCCNLARYFCGPDDSEWVSERFDTPGNAIATFREAIRRADTSVIARCFSEHFKETTGLTGPIEAAIAWERIQDEVPGVHVLGYADVSPREDRGPSRCEYVLTVSGHRMRVDLVRQPFWEIRWIFDPSNPEDLEPRGDFLRTPSEILERGIAVVTFDEEEYVTDVQIRLPTIETRLELEQIVRAGTGFDWKVDRLEPVVDQDDDG